MPPVGHEPANCHATEVVIDGPSAANVAAQHPGNPGGDRTASRSASRPSMSTEVRLLRPDPTWAAAASRDRPDALDSFVMEARDRLTNLGFFAAAGVGWV